MYEIRVETEFAAAHFLREYKGKCENLHGHNWKIEVRFRSKKLDRAGMLMDFKHAREIIGKVVDRFDHRYLNEIQDFKKVNPTTENLARIFFNAVKPLVPEGVSVHSVTCWESERCGAMYVED